MSTAERPAACCNEFKHLIVAVDVLPPGRLGLRCPCGTLWTLDPNGPKATDMVCVHCGEQWVHKRHGLNAPKEVCASPRAVEGWHRWSFQLSQEHVN